MQRVILIADGDSRLREILAGHDLVVVHTLEEAQRAVERARFDMILIAVHFDDSRMFDLLRYLQASGRHGERPVVCVRSQQFASPAITIEGLEIATKALGCTLFLDLTWYAGNEEGNGAVRRLLEALLSS